MTTTDRAAEIIERATRGAHTTDGHPMKMSDHTAQIIAEALADDGALVRDQWEYAAIELRPNGPFHDDPDSYSWSAPRWWHPTEQDALDDLKTEFMQWRYGTSIAARIIRRPKPHAPEVARHLYPNPHCEGDENRAARQPLEDKNAAY